MTRMSAVPSTLRWVALGAGGHAASVADALRGVADLAAVVGASSRSWQVPVLGSDAEGIAWATEHRARVLVAIGDNTARMRVLDTVPRDLLLAAAAPSATIAEDVTLGRGSVVLHQGHVGPGASIGAGVVVNTAAVVEHDCVIGDGAHVAPGACVLGEASVGSGALVGSGARVLPGRRVGAGATIGAGAIVSKDVAEGAVVVGVTH